jgi:glycosyltransferase involved in cell wall biosynthesis
MRAPVPVTVVVLTCNEERNLDACLQSVAGWVARIIVVDSGSTDGTLAIARRQGAEIAAHPFDTHAAQWRWALEQLPIATDWVLGLDADQRVTPALRASIEAAFAGSGPLPDGFFLCRRQIFQGRWIRHGGYYPKYLLKLFRRDAVSIDLADRVDHHFRVSGATVRLRGDLVEDNQNERRLGDWIDKHTRYARLQALEELEALEELQARGRPGRFWGRPDQRVDWFKRRWARLPLFLRPWLYFTYRYVFRLGFLDGREGFVFHFMQALWYRTLVDAMRRELESADPPSADERAAARRRLSA